MNSKVSQDSILSALMLGRILVLVQALSEWGAFGVDGAGVLLHCSI